MAFPMPAGFLNNLNKDMRDKINNNEPFPYLGVYFCRVTSPSDPELIPFLPVRDTAGVVYPLGS